jgi:hypothetical protein
MTLVFTHGPTGWGFCVAFWAIVLTLCLQHLTSLTNEQIVAELGWTRLAINRVLGVTPTTMRPPYGDIGMAISTRYIPCSSEYR